MPLVRLTANNGFLAIGIQMGFNWDEIFRRHKDPNRLDIAIWAGTEKKRLSALGLGLCTGESVLLRFLEGDPRSDCPLKRVRALIALEVASTYAQLMGRRELRVQPLNPGLVELYTNVYGFDRVQPRKEQPYFRKGVSP